MIMLFIQRQCAEEVQWRWLVKMAVMPPEVVRMFDGYLVNDLYMT